MGIKNGAPTIITINRRGLYNKRPHKYKINVDGEFMRYKGMIEINLTKHNAEEAIAATSFDFMKRLIDEIELHLGRKASEVVIYMDGTRVFNKESGRADFKFDAGLIRMVFKTICSEYGFTVIELQHGESELQMYLQRDKSVDLNVFLTSDSDMLSICYGHTPSVVDENYSVESQKQDTTSSIIDQNMIYVSGTKVLDSCVWVNSCKVVTYMGFDFIRERVKYDVFQFRTFISLCGTDFTNSLLTESMISAILLAEDSDIETINKLTDINHIAAGLLLLGIRGGGTIKRFDDRAKNTNYDALGVDKSVRMYLDYVGTGKMENSVIPKPNMSLMCRHYLYAMRRQDTSFVKKALCVWAKNCTILEAMENLKSFLGTYNPHEECTTKSASRKRKAAVVVENTVDNNQTVSKIKCNNQGSDGPSNVLLFNCGQKTVFDDL